MRKLLQTAIILILTLTGFVVSAQEEEPFVYTGNVASVESNDIILEDDIVINTSPKTYSNDEGWTFEDNDGNGDNDLLEAMIGSDITVEGEPVYEEVEGVLALVAVDAYTITYTNDAGEIVTIFIRKAGKAPWARGPKS